MTFHLIFVNIIFSLVWVAEWPPFGKELPTQLSICSLCILTICYLSFFAFRSRLSSTTINILQSSKVQLLSKLVLSLRK